MSSGHAIGIAIAGVAISATACTPTRASTATPPKASAPQPTELEIEVGGVYSELKTGPDGVAIHNTTDVIELLDEGNRPLAVERVDDALSRYRRLLELFPRSPLASAAELDAGLALERAGRPTEARARRAHPG